FASVCFRSSSHLLSFHSFPTRRSSDLTCPGVPSPVQAIVPLPGQCGGYLQRFCQTCFDGNQIGEAGAQALAASPHLAGLTTLNLDRKSTRLNSSHRTTSYAVLCLKKKS